MSQRTDDIVMSVEEFRAAAHEMVEWMADYMRGVHRMPVTPRVGPGDIKRRLEAAPPEAGESFDAIFDDFRKIIVPGMTHWQHPSFFAYFPANASPASVLAEMATAAMGANCMSWVTSPAATELEEVVMDWLRDMVGLPAAFRGCIQDSASTSTLVAILAARERACDFRFGPEGAAAPGADRLTVYASTEAHSSVARAVRFAGLGQDRLRLVATDASFALDPAALEAAIAADQASGLKPCCVVGVAGSTSSTAMDPLRRVGEIARRHGMWYHVDAAYAGSAAIIPALRPLFDGWDLADSVVFNPHKWLFTNFDASAFFVRDLPSLLRTCSISPEYLKAAQDGAVPNFRDWGIHLGRRFRALKLWFVIRSFGLEGLRTKVQDHIDIAKSFRRWVDEHPDFECLAPSPFGLVCFRWNPDARDLSDADLDAANARLLEAINATGRCHMTHTKLAGRYALRMCIGATRTKRADVEDAWRLVVEKADSLE